MIRWIKNLIKCLMALTLMASSILALYIYVIGDFDPVKYAIALKDANQRDQSLSVIEHSIEYNIGNQGELKELQEDYEYGLYEKSKDVFYHGAVKGNVFNAYSGMGCIASDLCVFGDARDLAKQGYNYVTGKDVDHVIAALSTVGIATTAAELTGGGVVVDAGVSVVKTTVKYISKTVRRIPDGILMLVKRGHTFKPEVYKQFWAIFKGTGFNLPNFTSVLSAIKNPKHIKTAAHLTENAKTGAVIFIHKSGEAGLKTYGYFQKNGFGKWYLECIKKNPKAALGISKFNTILRSAKFIKKHGILVLLSIIGYFIASVFLMVGSYWLPVFVLVVSAGYLRLKFRRSTRREKVKSKLKPGLNSECEPTAAAVDRAADPSNKINPVYANSDNVRPNVA